MSWHLDQSRPICPQLCEHICVQIATGELKAGERLPSVRDMAMQAGVNPNTVQKAFQQLEQNGLLYSVWGSGWFVGESTTIADETRENLVKQKTALFFEEMRQLGFDEGQTKEWIGGWNRE